MQSEYKSLLSGHFDLTSLPDVPSKLIRVYICCTPTDMVVERGVLTEKVYPSLREYSREKYGLELQIVDPRWGVLAENWADTCSERGLCLQEILQCRKLSVGPNFVAMIGQRYGDRPVPDKISATDFELLRGTLRHHRNRETRDAWLLDHFYKKDDNSIPPVYNLQTMDTVKESLKPKSPIDRLIIGDKELKWDDARLALKRLIQRGIEYCVLEGTMVDSDGQMYLISDFENELRQGIMFSNDPQTSCQVYMRNIVDAKNYITHPLAAKYLDITYNDMENQLELDNASGNRLTDLRDEQLPRWLGESNKHSFTVLWKHDEGIDAELHCDYLQELCQTFGDDMRRLIDCTAHSQLSEQLPPAVEEVFQHWLMVKQTHEDFVGRAEVMDIIQSYIVSNDSKPLVLYGEPGSGKTATMAKAASEVCTWVKGEVVAVVRFLGLTMASYDIRQIIYNISMQLATTTDADPKKVPTGYKDLQNYFFKALETFPDDKNLVIFLDGLNLLVPQYNAHHLNWMPKVLKENVKIVVTTAPEIHGILQRFKTKLVLEVNNFVEIGPLTVSQCEEMLNGQLRRESRCLSPQQKSITTQAFASCAYPLFVKLLLTEVRTWTSYKATGQLNTPSSIKEYIYSFFDQLEKGHGKELVSRSLAYLTASTTGMSDCEMEDLLSLDDTVLEEVYSGGNPHIRRLPPLVWLRLKAEISDFLVRKECEGINVFFWSHRLFDEAVKSQYLNDDAIRKDIHSCLADYMLGTWHKVAKPYSAGSSNSKGDDQIAAADRLVPNQPLTFHVSDTVTRFNKRKYDQVPRQLYLSGRLKELNELVLFNYSWLYNKTKALSLDHILADFVLNPGVEATLVERALRDAQSFIEKNVDNMAPEISGRLLAYYSTHPNIRKLIEECDTEGLEQCGLIPNFPYHQVPGSPLKYTIECQGKPVSFGLVGKDSRYICAKERSSQSIQIFDLGTGEHKVDILTSVGDMYITPNGQKVAIVDHVTEKAVKIHDSSTGKFLGQLIPLNQVQMKPKEKYKLGQISVRDSHLAMLVTTEKSYLCVADLETCKFIQVLGLENRGAVCQLTPDSRYVYCNSDKTLLGFDVETMEQVNSTALDHRPTQLLFTNDGSHAFMINSEENKVYALTLQEGTINFVYKIVLTDSFHGDQVCDLQLSQSQELLLARGKSNLVVYNASAEKIVCHFPRPTEIPLEFKLPKSHYTGISYTAAHFSPDDKFVIATIFRNIYIWHVANNRLLTTLQAPVGIVRDLYVPLERGQIVTHLDGASVIHVWSLGDAIGHVGMLDRLTTTVSDIKMSGDNKLAYVRCEDSDEIGVLEMSSGQLKDLLTHDHPVDDFSISASGDYAFVSLKTGKANTVNKIWHIEKRKVIYEFGSIPAYSIALGNEDSLIAIYQDSNLYKSPYNITQFKCKNGGFEEFNYQHPVSYILQKPFVIPEDRYLIILSAADYDNKKAFYKDPTLCAVSLRTNAPLHQFSADDFQDRVRIRRLLRVCPCPNSSYTVIVLYTNESLEHQATNEYEHCYGLLVLDVCSGVICQVIDEMLAPSTPITQVFFTPDLRLAIDNKSNIFDMETGFYVKKLHQESDIPPRLLAKEGKVAIYYSGQHIFALRIEDGKCIGSVNVHGEVTSLAMCNDERTLVAGCRDGSIMSYVLLDSSQEDSCAVLTTVTSRQAPLNPSKNGMMRLWDKINDINTPPYSRPPSAMKGGPQDRDRLASVRPASILRPTSNSLATQRSSRACSIM